MSLTLYGTHCYDQPLCDVTYEKTLSITHSAVISALQEHCRNITFRIWQRSQTNVRERITHKLHPECHLESRCYNNKYKREMYVLHGVIHRIVQSGNNEIHNASAYDRELLLQRMMYLRGLLCLELGYAFLFHKETGYQIWGPSLWRQIAFLMCRQCMYIYNIHI